MASHALLLRLFLSPSFFSVHVALRYLNLYADNVGITYYLTRRLREVDIQDLQEVWGFICHLLVTRPSRSRALECFVVDIARRYTHVAVITLWFMQAAIRDFALARHETTSFQICQRVLHHCHEIIFGDILAQSSSPYEFLTVLPQGGAGTQRKIRPHIEPALVGIGLMLAGIPGLPLLTQVMGEVAIEQGRVEDNPRQYKDIKAQEPDIFPDAVVTDTITADEDEDTQEDSNPDEVSADQFHASPSENLPRTALATSHGTRLRAVGAQTTPALLVHAQDGRRPKSSDDPLGQVEPPSPKQTSTPYQSTPSVSAVRSTRTSTQNTAEVLLQRCDRDTQSHLLRSYYCRSEIQFLLNLEYISNRLMVVPRPARVSALRAELTILNHKLPAEVCMPLWCGSVGEGLASATSSNIHHRIVRIPPGECVVLNSAARAPYVLLIEILNDDLDFDPLKRNNKQVLKNIIARECERTGASRDLISFTTSQPLHRKAFLGESVQLRDFTSVAVEKHNIDVKTQPQATPVDPGFTKEEEVDLVEQLFGSGIPLRAQPIDVSESGVFPRLPQNRDLDMATWSSSISPPSSPLLEPPPITASSSNTSTAPSSSPLSLQDSGTAHTRIRRILSLDEYAERMRIAAVMLAQLDENIARAPVSSLVGIGGQAPSADATTAIGRLLGSNRINSTVDSSQSYNNSQLSGSRRSNDIGGLGGVIPSSRLKLSSSEAATIRERIMKEMNALERERMQRMRESEVVIKSAEKTLGMKSAEDELIIRRELNRVDPSALVFSESWAAKKSRIRQSSPYGHLANWDCVSVIVKTGDDLRQEQLAVQLIKEFQNIWKEENCRCWLRFFRILITGGASGLVETITDAVSIHSIKKAEYARLLSEGRLGHVTLLDHFRTTYGDPSSRKFMTAQKNFVRSLAGYSVVTYLLQIKDRHNGNILLDREGHLIHIDFGFMLSNSPGNLGFEAAPFKLPPEYIELLGGTDAPAFLEFKQLFREGFESARKHRDRILTLVELMQKDSTLPCFVAAGENTVIQLEDRFGPNLTHASVVEYVDRLIDNSLCSTWTRLYDSYQYYSQSIL